MASEKVADNLAFFQEAIKMIEWDIVVMIVIAIGLIFYIRKKM